MFLAILLFISCLTIISAYDTQQIQFIHDSDVKVPVQLAVMSQCPDALYCERVFRDVIEEVSDKMNFSLIYVAQLDPLAPVFNVSCKHGPLECAGNVQQLCAQRYSDFSTWWKFVECQNAHGRYQVGLPDVAFQCAKDVGIDWKRSGVGKCAGLDGSGTGREGVQLLQDSVRVVRNLQVEKSCTVIVNDEKICVRDDEEWKDCSNGHNVEDFVMQINEAYANANSGT